MDLNQGMGVLPYVPHLRCDNLDNFFSQVRGE